MKTVKQPTEVKRLLQPASTNSKLGAGKTKITRGRWRGMPLYQLVLEERKTCPKTCQQWASCYGNNMFLANRIDHKSKNFLTSLATEIASLSTRHPGGFVVRLHVLGDFYSKSYVQFWKRMLRRHTALHVFGYTHRMEKQKDGIGRAVAELNRLMPGQWCVRFSDKGGPMSANVGTALDGNEIMCPQERGETESCLTCGLCWSEHMTGRSIGFTEH